MATMCKLYTDEAQTIQPQTWTTIKFDLVLKDTGTMYQGSGSVDDPDSALIMPDQDGDFIWFSKVHWDSIGIPAEDERPRQFLEQFCRDPYSEDDEFPDADSTGSEDGNDTPGREFNNNAWAFRGVAGEPVAVRVWHDHHEPVAVTHAQFVAMTWDY